MPELTRTENNFIFLLRAALADHAVEAREIVCDCDDREPEVRETVYEGNGQAVETGEIATAFDSRRILRLAYNHKLWHMILSVMPRELIPHGIDVRAPARCLRARRYLYGYRR